MGDTKSDRLAHALDAFLATSPDLEAAAVVSFDGLTMASALPDEMEDDRVGAMAAALLSLGEQAARGLGTGELNQLFVEADEGFVFLMSARDQAVLVAVTNRDAKIGFVLYEMRRAAWEVGSILEGKGGSRGFSDEGPGRTDYDSLNDASKSADAASPFEELNGESLTVGARGPFGDTDLDDPSYMSSNGRSTDAEDLV